MDEDACFKFLGDVYLSRLSTQSHQNPRRHHQTMTKRCRKLRKVSRKSKGDNNKSHHFASQSSSQQNEKWGPSFSHTFQKKSKIPNLTHRRQLKWNTIPLRSQIVTSPAPECLNTRSRWMPWLDAIKNEILSSTIRLGSECGKITLPTSKERGQILDHCFKKRTIQIQPNYRFLSRPQTGQQPGMKGFVNRF